MKPFNPSEGLVDNTVTNCMTTEKSKVWPSCMITSATWNKTYTLPIYKEKQTLYQASNWEIKEMNKLKFSLVKQI